MVHTQVMLYYLKVQDALNNPFLEMELITIIGKWFNIAPASVEAGFLMPKIRKGVT